MIQRRFRAGILGSGTALLLSCAFMFPAQAETPNWADVEGRIQYAYYTEDTRALNGVLASLKPKPAEDAEEAAKEDPSTRDYFQALAHYRLAQVLAASSKSKAKDAIGECGDAVDQSVEALPKVTLGLDESDESRHASHYTRTAG